MWKNNKFPNQHWEGSVDMLLDHNDMLCILNVNFVPVSQIFKLTFLIIQS